MEWDFDRLADKASRAPGPSKDPELATAKLAKYFKLTDLGRLDEPCTVLDRNGRIMVWYLPNLLYPSRVVFKTFHLLPSRLLTLGLLGHAQRKAQTIKEHHTTPQG